MKILLLAPHPFYQHRGTPIAVKLLIDILSRHGNEITLLTYPEGEDLSFPNCRIIRLPFIPGIRNIKPGPSWKKIVYDLLLILYAAKMMRKNNFHVVHAVEESAFIGILLKSFFKTPYIYDMDSSISRQIIEKFHFLNFMFPLLEWLEKKAVMHSIGVLPVCKAIEETVRSYAPEVLIQRIEDISLLPEQIPEEGRGNHDLGIQKPVVMYVGNLERYQGIDLLLESFGTALPSLGETQLVVIGGNEKDIEYYRRKADELTIGAHAHFTGPKPIQDLHYYLTQADILVSPRLKGYNTPMKIYSYLDSGKPVIATRLPTHTQVLDDTVAYLVEPDKNMMAQALIDLISDRELGEKLACQAKKLVKEQFTYEAYERKIITFYNHVKEMLT